MSQKKIDILKKTIEKLKQSKNYSWGHQGSCNCGHLIQVVTDLKRKVIHDVAQQKYGDWRDKTKAYCETSGLEIDNLLYRLLCLGFSLNEIEHLERLSDPKVLEFLESKNKYLRHNVKDHAIQYIEAWIKLLEYQPNYLPSNEEKDIGDGWPETSNF